MKLLKKIGIGLVALILLIVIVSLLLPSKIHVERSLVINAPAERIFEQVNTLKYWNDWCPWNMIDPNAKWIYNDIPSGKGASYKWTSEHKEVGNGTMTVVESQPNTFIAVELDFDGRGKGMGTFKFEPADGGTKTTWGMDADMGMNPIGKIMGLFMDKMMGPKFDEGLQNLKKIAETKSEPTTAMYKVEEVETPSMFVMTMRKTVKTSEIGQTLGELYGMIGEKVKAQKLEMAGPVFAIYHSYSPDTLTLEAGVQINKPGKTEGMVNAYEMPAGKAAFVDYYGAYEGTEPVYAAINEWASANGKKLIRAPWEVYVTDPMMEKDTAKWNTKIYYPVE